MTGVVAAGVHRGPWRAVPDRDVSLTGQGAPVDDASRIRDLDVIRGVALFGVVWMNLHESTTWFVPHQRLDALASAPVDRIVDTLAEWLVLGKAQCLFGILFGFGFAIFTERAMQRRSDAGLLYARRLTALLVLGVVQYIFLWWGDILHDYALVGFLLLPSRRLPDRFVLVAGVTLMLFSEPLARLWAAEVAHVDLSAIKALGRAHFHTVMWDALSSGDYAGLLHGVAVRTRLMYANPSLIENKGHLLGQFLFGAWLFRKGWLRQVSAHPRLFNRTAALCVPVGLALSAVDLYGHSDLAGEVSVPLLALGYGALLVVAGRNAFIHRHMAGLAAFGRMALTNYVAQSFIYFFVDYGFGFDLIEKVGTSVDLVLALAITAAQVGFSLWWLRRYRFGPLEWVWRSVTYNRRQTLTISG